MDLDGSSDGNSMHAEVGEAGVGPSDAPPAANRRRKRLSKRAELRAAKSTNAIACPDFFQRGVGARLSRPDGRPAALARFLQLSCMLGGLGAGLLL
jgi:hypothetical protein